MWFVKQIKLSFPSFSETLLVLTIDKSFPILHLHFYIKFLYFCEKKQNRLVLSANMTDDKYLETRERSFMYIKKWNGPRVETCGTLHFTCSKYASFCSSKSFLYSAYCFLFE